MAVTCTYVEAGAHRHPTEHATHVVLLDTQRHTWGLFAADAVGRAAEFCLGCAGQVMEARNRAHRTAREARLLRPTGTPTIRCPVCHEGLEGVGMQLAGVGALCTPCYRTATEAELMDDPRLTPPPKKRKRKAAA